MKHSVPVEIIASKIYLIRGQKVMLDRDLSQLYVIETRVLNQAVSRKIERFPTDCQWRRENVSILPGSKCIDFGLSFRGCRGFVGSPRQPLSVRFRWYPSCGSFCPR
jgi:hypothetical protein